MRGGSGSGAGSGSDDGSELGSPEGTEPGGSDEYGAAGGGGGTLGTASGASGGRGRGSSTPVTSCVSAVPAGNSISAAIAKTATRLFARRTPHQRAATGGGCRYRMGCVRIS